MSAFAHFLNLRRENNRCGPTRRCSQPLSASLLGLRGPATGIDHQLSPVTRSGWLSLTFGYNMKNLILILFIIGITNAQADLQLEHFDSSQQMGVVTFSNGPDEIIKRWTWTRDGVVILSRIVKELALPNPFTQIEQILYQGESKIFYSLFVNGNPSEIFYPAPLVEIARSDTDRDGQIDTISLLNSEQKLVELYSVDDAGLIEPQSDAQLNERRELLDSISENMKGF